MLSAIRHFQKEVLIVITAVIVVSFAFLYSDLDFTAQSLGTPKCVIEVNGHCYRAEEALKLARLHDFALSLGLSSFVRTLRGPNRMDLDPTDFVLNLLVLRKEAEKLGIQPSEEEIKNQIAKLPALQQPMVDKQMIRNFLGESGLDEGDLAQLARDYFAFNMVNELLGAGVEAVPAEVEKAYIAFNQKYSTSLVRFDVADQRSKVTVSDADINQFFEDRNGADSAKRERQLEPAENPNALAEPTEAQLAPLMTEPLRGFDYVKFTPTELDENATNEEKAKSGITFAKEVNRIYADLTDEEKDFVTVGKQHAAAQYPFKVEFGIVDPFERDEAPEIFKDSSEVVAEAFSDTLRFNDISPPFQGAGGAVFILKFSREIKPGLMTLEEARPAIQTALQIKKANQMASDAANVALAQLKEGLTAGKSILDLAGANGLNLVDLPVFSVTEPPSNVEGAGSILQVVRGLAPGELSPVTALPEGKGYFIAYINKIEVFKNAEKEDRLRSLAAFSALREKENLFLGWLTQRGRESGAKRVDSILNIQRRQGGR